MTPDIDKYLYHYTTMKALFGIIKNKEFWWGNTSTMNDKKELIEFTNKLINVAKEDAGDSWESGERAKAFSELVREKSKDYPYAMCFSSLEEDASQWERYADKAQGVCLKINTGVFQKLLENCNVVFNSIYYNSDIREQDFYPAMKRFFETGKTEGGIENLVSNILTSAPSFKNRSFWAECESRVYTLIGTEFCSNTQAYRIGYECKDNSIKRYLKIKYDALCAEQGVSHDELFEELVVGPRSEQNLDELRQFIEAMGFPRLSQHIRKSDCPLR